MITPDDVLKIARQEVGYKEQPTNRTMYGRWYGMDGQPWCAMFVSWVFARAQSPLPAKTANGFAYCPDGVNYFKRTGRWFTSPKVGDVVFYEFNGDKLADHVGIVSEVYKDGSILAIEGNTNAAGSSEGLWVEYKRRKSNILGYGRPLYNAVEQPSAQLLTTRILDTKEILSVKLIEFATPPMDDKGNGWILFNGTPNVPDIPEKKLLSVIPQGSAPARDKGYWPVPAIGLNGEAGKVLITIIGARPNEPLVLSLLVAE